MWSLESRPDYPRCSFSSSHLYSSPCLQRRTAHIPHQLFVLYLLCMKKPVYMIAPKLCAFCGVSINEMKAASLWTSCRHTCAFNPDKYALAHEVNLPVPAADPFRVHIQLHVEAAVAQLLVFVIRGTDIVIRNRHRLVGTVSELPGVLLVSLVKGKACGVSQYCYVAWHFRLAALYLYWRLTNNIKTKDLTYPANT